MTPTVNKGDNRGFVGKKKRRKKLFFLGVLKFELLMLLLEYLLSFITFPMPSFFVILKLFPT
jgi:hypothetical protein